MIIADACPKLERLSTECSCWTGIAKVALTQNSQELRINGSAQRSFEDAALEKSVDIEDVQESGLHEAYYSVLDLNKAPHEAQSSTKQYRCDLRVLRLSNLSLQHSNFWSTLSGLQELHLDEVHLKDEGTLCLEGCIHLKGIGIGGGNVRTVTGIGKLCELSYVELHSMEDLLYLRDLEWQTRHVQLCITNCEGYKNTNALTDNNFLVLTLCWVVLGILGCELKDAPFVMSIGSMVLQAIKGKIPTRRRIELANRQFHLGL